MVKKHIYLHLLNTQTWTYTKQFVEMRFSRSPSINRPSVIWSQEIIFPAQYCTSVVVFKRPFLVTCVFISQSTITIVPKSRFEAFGLILKRLMFVTLEICKFLTAKVSLSVIYICCKIVIVSRLNISLSVIQNCCTIVTVSHANISQTTNERNARNSSKNYWPFVLIFCPLGTSLQKT
jgi:hypothetical protein